MGDFAMPDMSPSKLAKAKLSEKEAWQRYAAAKADDWVEARDASMAAWADEVTSRGR